MTSNPVSFVSDEFNVVTAPLTISERPALHRQLKSNADAD
jgi:hypothetical protein